MKNNNENNSTFLPPIDENASLYPFHVNLAQAEIPVPPNEAAVKNDAEQVHADTTDEVKQEEVKAEDKADAKPEDPGVMLLPDTADDVIKIELKQELPIDDDGSKELYRIYHNNNGLVEDVPRDLGIPPVIYELPKTEITFINEVPAQPVSECCHSEVELTVYAYTGEGSLIIGGDDEGGESLYTTIISFDSDPTATVFIGELIHDSSYSNGSSSSSEQHTNDFSFSFAYSNCDVDGDGVLDSQLTFTFENTFTYNLTVIDGESSGGATSTIYNHETIIIDAPPNDDCCSFNLVIDEVDFAYAISNATSGGYNILSASDVLNYFTDNYYNYFTDCDNNRYTIDRTKGGYQLEELQTAPVVLDLTGDGIHLTTVEQGVVYDVNHDNIADASAWIGAGNGFLIYDVNQDHTVNNASEFVLTEHVPGAKTDLEALRLGFDTNHDNVFDQNDAQWNLFGVWQDVNKDAVVDNGEYHTLAQLGIVSIDLTSNPNSESVMNGNSIFGISSFTRSDGSTGAVADVALQYQAVLHDESSDTIHSTQQSSATPTSDQSHILMAQNDPVVQSTVEQLANHAAVATA